MIGDGAVGLRFFRIFLPDFSSHMMIPHVFDKYISKQNKVKERVTLVSRDGKIWHVELRIHNTKLCFGGEGWKLFATANELKVGYALTFRYTGNMVFSFRVFDLSTCEITSSPCVQMHQQKNKIGNANSIDESDSISIEETAPEYFRKRKAGHNENRTAQKIRKCDNGEGYFEIIIRPGHIKSTPLVQIVARFIEHSGLAVEDKDVKLRDPMGRIWRVHLYHRNNKNQLYMTTGFREFAYANRLKIGDKCIFEMESQGETKVFQVKIDKLND